MTAEANEILTGLWLGNILDSKNIEFVNKMDIIINCSKNIPFLLETTKNIRIPVDDNLEESEKKRLLKFLPKITSFIHNRLQEHKKILVHCHAGKQRSVSVIVAYLIRFLKMSLEKAHLLVKTKRSIIFTPCVNFNSALVKFESDFKRN